MSDSWDPMDCSLLGSSVHGILQARILEQVSISFSRGPSQSRVKPTSLESPGLTGRFLFCFVLFCFLTVAPPGKPTPQYKIKS